MTAIVTAPPAWPADAPVHPAAELFPLMTGAEFAVLTEDIAENGLTHPIVRTPDGAVLDGRNRYRACLDAGVEPVFTVHDGDAWRFVVSSNLHRRHLTDGQRTLIASKLAERSSGQYPREANVPAGTFGQLPLSREEAAELLNVSPRQVARARQVLKHGTEPLIKAVETGEVAVTTAARVAVELPADEQDAFVEQINAGADPRKTAPPPTPTPAPRLDDAAGDTTRDQPTGSNNPSAQDEPLSSDLAVGPASTAPPPASRRKPITDQAEDAGWDIRKAAERIGRILNDDRYATNCDQVGVLLRGNLLFARDQITAALDRLGDGVREGC